MDQWYYVVAGAQQGPVTVEQLQGLIHSGQVAGDTQVWCERMAGWEPANRLPEFSFAQAAQPGYPPAGYPQGGGMPLGYQSAMPAYGTPLYAGFWIRVGAYIIDYILLLIPTVVVAFIIGMIAGLMLGSRLDAEALELLKLVVQLFFMLMAWLYYAIMESSAKQATFGKMICGLKVTDIQGQRITFGQASGRFFGQIISSLICCVGYMMAGWTEKKQALHDIMAGTLVVRK
jgi:uncharacterized RDD family membrane protein YckC